MHVSREFVSAETPPPAADHSALVIGVNWLGDSIMAMPALQSFHRRHPRTRLAMVVRPHLAPLWRMHPAVDEVMPCSGALPELKQLIRTLKHRRPATAYVWPRSFRSALAPWLAGIPRRYGLPGHCRDWMLTDVIPPPADDRRHQAFEYLNLMGDATVEIEPPLLQPPVDLQQQWRARCQTAGAATWVALLPGAAFGPAKRWPAERFAEVGRHLQRELSSGVVVLGSKAEYELCQQVADQIGGQVINLAGQTSLTDLAAILAVCRLAVTNDSGGMHLAAAVHVPVVAIFGITNPDQTGPVGPHVCVLQKSEFRARDFKGQIHQAAASLAAITPEQVVEAALRLAVAAEGKP